MQSIALAHKLALSDIIQLIITVYNSQGLVEEDKLCIVLATGTSVTELASYRSYKSSRAIQSTNVSYLQNAY